jgi:hypothetical protein
VGELQWVRFRDTGFYEARDARGLRYECRWTPYGTRKTWQLYVEGERVALAFSSRLSDVQAYGQKAAELYA